jgi:cytochrome bd-type quinol oxidase subunit 2
MNAWAEFDLGEFLGIGLGTTQIAYLGGALFLGLFGISALRHAKRAGGFAPAIWIAIALALLLGCFLVAARGFPDLLPVELKSFADPERLARVAAVFALLACAVVLLSAHWVRGSLGKFICRVMGFCVAGLAVWLAASWFQADVPDDVRPWTARSVIARAVVVLGLLCLAAAFWMRQVWGSAHARWINRALSPIALGIAIVLAGRWFVAPSWQDYPTGDVERVTCILAAIACGTCLLVAAGAYFLRERPAPPKKVTSPVEAVARTVSTPKTQLPVAVLLDESGRPVLPRASAPRSGPAGA